MAKEKSKSTDKASKRKTGAFYTPQPIAEYMVRRAVDARVLELFSSKVPVPYKTLDDAIAKGTDKDLKLLESKVLDKLTILDPACGDGAFLLACMDRLCAIREEVASRIGGRRPDPTAIRRKVLACNLYGVDFDQRAIGRCVKALMSSAHVKARDTRTLNEVSGRIKLGNSLLGFVAPPSDTRVAKEDLDVAYVSFLAKRMDDPLMKDIKEQHFFHWCLEFPTVMASGGFDIVLGNPPYGDSVLTDAERAAVRSSYSLGTTSSDGRGKGSVNPSSVFIERCYDVLKDGGQLAYILPSSMARVREFERTRRFLMDRMPPWHIVDEGSPFKGVTLEMFTLIARKGAPAEDARVEVLIRKGAQPLAPARSIPLSVFEANDRFMFYWDELFNRISAGSTMRFLTGRRGPTYPKELCSKRHDKDHPVPLLVSGRAVQRFRIVPAEFTWATPKALEQPEAKAVFPSTQVVGARLMDHYRVCVKPPNHLVGDNVVRLEFDPTRITPEALCIILNSRLMRYLVRRYLFNESELTMFIQSVAEATPIRTPVEMDLFTLIGRAMHSLGASWPNSKTALDAVDRWLSDPLVYELYLFDNGVGLAKALKGLLPQTPSKARQGPELIVADLVNKSMGSSSINSIVDRIYADSVVRRIEATLASWDQEQE